MLVSCVNPLSYVAGPYTDNLLPAGKLRRLLGTNAPTPLFVPKHKTEENKLAEIGDW
jgi:hypothetical protein